MIKNVECKAVILVILIFLGGGCAREEKPSFTNSILKAAAYECEDYAKSKGHWPPGKEAIQPQGVDRKIYLERVIYNDQMADLVFEDSKRPEAPLFVAKKVMPDKRVYWISTSLILESTEVRQVGSLALGPKAKLELTEFLSRSGGEGD